MRYAADQADFRVGQIGAARLGLPGADQDPFAHFPLGSLAMNATDGLETLAPGAVQGAWAVLAFDGPLAWRKEALRRLKRLDQGNSYLVSLCARAANGDPVAGARLVRHLRLHGLPMDRDKTGSPVYTSVAGFALRALARMSTQGIHGSPASKPRHTAGPYREPASTAHPERR